MQLHTCASATLAINIISTRWRRLHYSLATTSTCWSTRWAMDGSTTYACSQRQSMVWCIQWWMACRWCWLAFWHSSIAYRSSNLHTLLLSLRKATTAWFISSTISTWRSLLRYSPSFQVNGWTCTAIAMRCQHTRVSLAATADDGWGLGY